jgi:glycosyltransferase involved in cell wall biosynthesis
MPPITALLHTANDALRLGRALETLLPCSELLIVDHQSTDATLRVARRYGARVVSSYTVLSDAALSHASSAAANCLDLARNDWFLCLDPSESITEGLQATLFEWSSLPAHSVEGTLGFSVQVRKQVAENWCLLPHETRLVPRNWNLWNGRLPAHEPSSITLEGELLRLSFP